MPFIIFWSSVFDWVLISAGSLWIITLHLFTCTNSPFISWFSWFSLMPNTLLFSFLMTVWAWQPSSYVFNKCVSAAADCRNQCVFSCLCSLFAELNGSPVTKKHRRSGKNEICTLESVLFCGRYAGLSFLLIIVSWAAQRRSSECKASVWLCVFPHEELTVFTSN